MPTMFDELMEIFAESWKRQGELLHRLYWKTVSMYDNLDRIYADFSQEVARSPLTDIDKKQAILNYILSQNEVTDD